MPRYREEFDKRHYADGLKRDCGASNDWITIDCCEECDTIVAFECRRCGHRVYA